MTTLDCSGSATSLNPKHPHKFDFYFACQITRVMYTPILEVSCTELGDKFQNMDAYRVRDVRWISGAPVWDSHELISDVFPDLAPLLKFPRLDFRESSWRVWTAQLMELSDIWLKEGKPDRYLTTAKNLFPYLESLEDFLAGGPWTVKSTMPELRIRTSTRLYRALDNLGLHVPLRERILAEEVIL